MMNGGQQIDPGLVQALANISTNGQQNQNLQQQLQLAQQLRQPMPTGQTHMAGNVAVRNSPLAAIGPAVSNYLADRKQTAVMGQQAELTKQLRDTTGKYMSAIAAAQNPQAVHPDSAPPQQPPMDTSQGGVVTPNDM